MESLASVYQAAGEGLLKPIKVYLLFNKNSGAFYGWAGWHEPHGFDTRLFDIAVQEEFNASTQTVIGIYPGYQVVEIADQPQQVGEAYVDRMTSEEILAKYSLESQVNNIAMAVLSLAAALGKTELPALVTLTDQVDHIQEILQVGNLRKEGYSSDDSFEFVTNQDFAEKEALIYEGGLGEIVGPRQVSALRR